MAQKPDNNENEDEFVILRGNLTTQLHLYHTMPFVLDERQVFSWCLMYSKIRFKQIPANEQENFNKIHGILEHLVEKMNDSNLKTLLKISFNSPII